MLRALFISLSESRYLRALAERSAIGQRISARFVAGTQVADVLRATCAVNQSGLSVSIDNLGENVSNAEEARASAHLYRQLLDEISARKLNANISLKLTHMGLDVNENLAREFRAWLVPIAISGRRFPPPAPEPGDHLLPRPTSPRRLGRPRPRSVPFLLNSWSGRVGDRTALYGSPPCAFLPAAPLAERRNAQG